MKLPKKGKRVEENTVFILSCEGEYGLRQRPDTGLLAGLWEFPNVSGKLQTDEVLTEVERMGLKPKEIFRQVERKHIFTHIRWELRGVYLEVVEKNHELTWFTEEQINARAALSRRPGYRCHYGPLVRMSPAGMTASSRKIISLIAVVPQLKRL